MSHVESEHGLRVQLATALRERDTAQAHTREWLRVVEKLRENLNATLLERDEMKESLAAANARADAAEAKVRWYQTTDFVEALAAARRDLVRQQELNAELHKGVCSGYAAPLSQMDRIGNAIVGAKAGHHDGAEVVAAVLNLASPAAGDSK